MQNYERKLFILAFDHRTSFTKKLFAITGRTSTPEEKSQIREYKRVIFDGFRKAVERGIPKDEAGILVDEEFGANIAREAKAKDYILAMPVEKSGQEEFDFEYGSYFGKHIESFDPNFVKVLIRYNPRSDREMNKRQTRRLKTLSDYLHKSSRLLLLELLVPPTSEQMLRVANSQQRYDIEIRPALMVEAIQELQQAGIEPIIWKLEGVQKASDANALVKQVKSGRSDASIITLGRGESMERVQDWIRTGAETSGVIGFAVGRTIFWEPLVALKNEKIDRKTAVENIADNYLGLVNNWKKWRKNLKKNRAIITKL